MSKTLGEKRVRIDFNVTLNGDIDKVKKKSADLINFLEDLKEINPNQEKSDLYSLAQRAYEEAAMWAVKAITCSDE